MRQEDLVRLKRNRSLSVEEAGMKKGALLFIRIAKAWLWNSGTELEACIRALKGIKKTKPVLLPSGLHAFLVYRNESVSILIGKEYARMLEKTTSAWRKVVLDGSPTPEKGSPLGLNF